MRGPQLPKACNLLLFVMCVGLVCARVRVVRLSSGRANWHLLTASEEGKLASIYFALSMSASLLSWSALHGMGRGGEGNQCLRSGAALGREFVVQVPYLTYMHSTFQ